MSALLAVCIPTHHGRLDLLRQAVDSVLDQITVELQGDVTVHVSDNASTDGTEELMRRYVERDEGCVTYTRNHEDLGLTRNILGVVEGSQGTFCWLLGSDDILLPGAVPRMVGILRRHADVAGVTTNRARADFQSLELLELDPVRELPDAPQHEHIYRTAPDAFRNCGLLHDFMSTQVVRRQWWVDAVRSTSVERLERTRMAPTEVIGLMILSHPVWMWCPDVLVRHRIGTSFLDEELGHRHYKYQLEIMRDRSEVWATLFGRNTHLYLAVMRKACLRSLVPRAVVKSKMRAGESSLRMDLELLMRMTRYFWRLPDFWLRRFPFLLLPSPIVRLVGRLSDPLYTRMRAVQRRKVEHPTK